MVVLMSKHEQIIMDFMAKNPSWERFKLREMLNKTFKDVEKEEYGSDFNKEEWVEPFPVLNYIPDGFYIDIENKTLHLLEVDGTSGTTENKLSKMIDLWWHIDSESWSLTLTSISVHSKAKSFMDDQHFAEIAFTREIELVKKEKAFL
jgi:hypothetical protein